MSYGKHRIISRKFYGPQFLNCFRGQFTFFFRRRCVVTRKNSELPKYFLENFHYPVCPHNAVSFNVYGLHSVLWLWTIEMGTMLYCTTLTHHVRSIHEMYCRYSKTKALSEYHIIKWNIQFLPFVQM